MAEAYRAGVMDGTTHNNRIIEAILEKEKTLCPGAVALIGIYGSFQTGDVQPLSDLDLLILISWSFLKKETGSPESSGSSPACCWASGS